MKTTVVNITRLGVLSLLMVLLVNATSYAQRGRRGNNLTAEQRAEKAAKRLTKKLGLNADQTAQVQAANLKMQTAKDAARTTRDRAAMKSASEAYRTELKTILTSEQYSKFEQMKKRKKRKGRRG
ncbi:multiple ligand-binding protein 1 [uncultured Microscilla sp.]|uniref:multiple ligand-binding protein 1 n=1 Tax=uncultured Microscilla sp. TaxID=432653 RepID=UPI00261F0C0E|nr:multiple ligand-binding protein 1 [uncultured Microscilla sp.]